MQETAGSRMPPALHPWRFDLFCIGLVAQLQEAALSNAWQDSPAQDAAAAAYQRLDQIFGTAMHELLAGWVLPAMQQSLAELCGILGGSSALPGAANDDSETWEGSQQQAEGAGNEHSNLQHVSSNGKDWRNHEQSTSVPNLRKGAGLSPDEQR